MRAPGARPRADRTSGQWGLGLLAGWLVVGCGGSPLETANAGEPPQAQPVAEGQALFHHEWLPRDERSPGGDGLGPAYNETSCVACHNQGGAGGAGGTSKNVELLSFSRNVGPVFRSLAPLDLTPPGQDPQNSMGPALDEPFSASQPPIRFSSGKVYADLIAENPPIVPWFDQGPLSRFFDELSHNAEDGPSLAELFQLHPGFRGERTVTLHRFGTVPTYASWREKQFPGTLRAPDSLTPFGSTEPARLPSFVSGAGRSHSPLMLDRARFKAEVPERTSTRFVGPSRIAVTRSERNPTPLFGLGLIDAIPESAVVAEAQRQVDQAPAIAGRVGRVTGGRIGRLGWKGQTASVAEFVRDACAVEVGLEVPGHAQGVLPGDTGTSPRGLDLTPSQCEALIAFVQSLPRPVERSATGAEAALLARGKAQFAAIGCAQCHTPNLGAVTGLYSDLLLHDMGSEMAGSGSYGGGSDDDETGSMDIIVLGRSNQPDLPVFRDQKPGLSPGARRSEWRTPPLWGLHDSAPYLHDGRAETLEQAIAFHAGQAEDSAHRFFGLSTDGRNEVKAFLNALVAPGSVPVDPLAMRR